MSHDRAREVVETLAAIPRRGSATVGERAAAAHVAKWLDGRVERERAHGTHWWPYGLPPALAAITGNRLLGLIGALTVIDDVEGRRTLRRRLPQRETHNVVAEIGVGPRTVVVHAHHDAAHGGLMFHPAIAQPDGPLPTLALVAAGPALVALGAKRTGRVLSAITAALFADCGLRTPVPGANDDASGVAALVLLAERFRVTPPPEGTRVILLSTGSEESMLEGMTAFADRHFRHFDRQTTSFVSVDSLGWDTLALRSGEGALIQRVATPELDARLRACARDQGVELREGVRFWIPTDGNVALKAGYAQVTLGSMQADGTYPGYHTNRDTPEHVHYDTIIRGADLIEALVRASH